MGVAITDKLIRSLAKPSKGAKICCDDALEGLGISVSASGNLSFILNYTIHGRERLMTIGQFPMWTTSKVKEQATTLRRMLDNGNDPLKKTS